MNGQKQLILVTALAASTLMCLVACDPKSAGTTKNGRLSFADQQKLAAAKNTGNTQTGTTNTPKVDKNGNIISVPATNGCRIADVTTPTAYGASEPLCDSLTVTVDNKGMVVLPAVKLDIKDAGATVFLTADTNSTDKTKTFSFQSPDNTKVITLLYVLPVDPSNLDATKLTVELVSAVSGGEPVPQTLTAKDYTVTKKDVLSADGKTVTQSFAAIRLMPQTIQTLPYAIIINLGDKAPAAAEEITAAAAKTAAAQGNVDNSAPEPGSADGI